MRASQLPTSRQGDDDSRPRAESPTSRDSPLERAAPPPGPAVLGRYRLLRRLGTGAFGTVWHAHDERLDREVAVKILPRERILGGRFEREAKAAARLAHPGIVTLYEAAVDDEGAYLVSELVVGGTLDELVTAGRFSDRDILAIGIALCDALDHAHAHGVVHRDVKPSNILVPARAGAPAQVAKLTDFGVARVVGGDSLTRTGDVIGTMAYMAPEQAEGREVGEAADLYSTALVLYEALTGVNPVLTGAVAVRTRRLGAYLPPLRRQRRELPRELGQAIDLALRPRARERGTVGELRAALSTSLDVVEDTAGVVEAPWPALARTAVDWRGSRDGVDQRGAAGGVDRRRAGVRLDSPPALGVRWPVRAVGAAVTAALSAWVSGHLLAHAPLPLPAIGLIAGLAVLVLPRLGWLALTLATAGISLVQGRPGLALVVFLASVVPLLALPRAGTLWALPAACPALGMLALAGAWPACASWAGTAWRRGALAAVGWIWLVIASPLAGHAAYVRAAPASARAAWMSSLGGAAHEVLAPLITGGLLAPAAVWALGAAVLPRLQGQRSTVLTILATCLWSAAVLAGAAIALSAGTQRHGVILVGEGVLGAVASVFAALAPDIARRRVGRPDLGDPDLQLA